MTSLAAAPRAGGKLGLSRYARRLRVGIVFWWRHGRWPNLDRPRLFNEWVQWRKLFDRSQALAELTDKLGAKDRVAGLGLPHLCVPTLWNGEVLPQCPPAPYPLMVKANHGCNSFRVVRNDADWAEARAAARRWVRRTYGAWLDEWHYQAARKTVLVEPFLGDQAGTLPEDYKVYVFNGCAAIVQHHVERGRNHRWTQYDRDWCRVGGAPGAAPPPDNLHAMIRAAETLGAGHDFLRVDFYDVDGRLWFGEFCLFPGSGLDPFDPVDLDEALGRLWSAARPG